MGEVPERRNTHPESQGALNRLLELQRYSLASYLLRAPPWTHRGDGPLVEAIRRVGAGQQAEAVRVGRLLVRRYGYAESGLFPTPFAGYDDLAAGYLARRLVEHGRLMIDEVARCAGQLAGDPEARRLAEEALAREKENLALLSRLALPAGCAAEAATAGGGGLRP